ncbi:hypothetical protein SLEP1_g30546 [Rubroshorea leprosula]|uniref:Uncharacterized protein n=1 Tax=Rubroshorea leprosula TaxID=152421 RepID=A0AAV5K8W6_9ROSI|nr:hypothetical protein SLEP1_g30546 [Rubroshorea leprosula]
MLGVLVNSLATLHKRSTTMKESTPTSPTKGRFVNKVRGSGFLKISLDDLAIELFDSSLRGHSNSQNANVNSKNGGGQESVTQRKGWLVLRHTSRSMCSNNGAVGRGVSESANSRRSWEEEIE